MQNGCYTYFMKTKLMLTPLVAALSVGAGAFVALTTASNAEVVNTIADLANNKKTVAYIYSRPMVEAMYKLAVEQDRKFGLQLDCKSEYKVEPFSISVLSPIDFPDDKQHPIKGIWNFRYQLQRCGESKFYNTLFIANSGGDTPPTPRAYYPGKSNAGPILIKDAMLSAVPSGLIQSGLKDCKDMDVFDMRVTEASHDVVDGGKTLKGVWGEAWTFRMCGQMVDVPITFIPDATGGGTSFVVTTTRKAQ